MESGHVFAHVGHVQSVVLDCQATSVVQNSPARVHAENQMSNVHEITYPRAKLQHNSVDLCSSKNSSSTACLTFPIGMNWASFSQPYISNGHALGIIEPALNLPQDCIGYP